MDRRYWLARFLSAFALPLLWPATRVFAQEGTETPTFEDRLKAGLLCRRPEEFAFIALVAAKVQTGELPQDMVLNTMKYAIRKRARFPFFYFQYALIRQAAALDVDLGPPQSPMNP
jgi:hypothetical protein